MHHKGKTGNGNVFDNNLSVKICAASVFISPIIRAGDLTINRQYRKCWGSKHNHFAQLPTVSFIMCIGDLFLVSVHGSQWS